MINQILARCAYTFILYNLLFSLNPYDLAAQNLVVNGGFEKGDKSRFASYVKDSGYVKIGTGSQLSVSDAEIYIQAKGKKSAGCFTSRNDRYHYPESLFLTLSNTLMKDRWYEISFFIKHGFGLYASNNQGIALSSKKHMINYHKLPSASIKLVNKSIGEIMMNNQEWEKYTFLYKSNGTEDILLIGNVFFTNPVKFEAIETPKDRYKGNMCLYLFDEVRIVPFENDLRVYFDKDSTSLSSNAKLSLEDLSNYLETIAYQKIIIKGYADKTGLLSKNIELAKLRAEEVRKFLEEKQVKTLDLEVLSFGGTDKFDANKLEWNRIVEIEVIQ